MPRYKLVVAYDGSDFIGWQRQARGRSIQGVLEDALFPFEGRAVTVTGAGRTDAGVHALGQVAAFTLERPFAAAAIVRALNARLPPAVRVLEAVEVLPSFHPRFNALAKTYRYTIFIGAVVSPYEYRYCWHLPGPIDTAAMRAAATLLVGRHDFAAFHSVGSDVASTERELFESRVECRPEGPHDLSRIGCSGPGTPDPCGAPRVPRYIDYVVRGDGFLRHMVRAIVGSLVEVGKGRRPIDWISDVLRSPDRANAGPTAPAQGLCLIAVEYAAPLAAQP